MKIAEFLIDYQRPLNRVPRERTDWLPLLTVAVLMTVLMVAASFAISVAEERLITARIYELTEQAIRTQTPACSIEVVAGIKVESCIRTVAQ